MARVAGVSVATVSRALRGLDRVSPETRERVLRVAEDLHYVASPTATSLASGRTRVVAVVAPFLTRWFFATLVSAIEKSLRARGHHVILFDLEDDSYDQRLPLSQNMLWKRVDGVITLNIPMTPDEVELVDRLGLPLVAIGSPVPDRACVRIDDKAAMRTAVDHLAGLGHTRIGYIGAVPQNVAHIQTPQDRLEAFLEAVGDLGLECDDAWILGLRLDRRGGRPRQRRAALAGEPADRHRRGVRRDGDRGARERPPARAARARGPVDHRHRRLRALRGAGPDHGAPGRRRSGPRRRRPAAAGPARRRRVERDDRAADRARRARVDRPRPATS